jgi:hypothetical protein
LVANGTVCGVQHVQRRRGTKVRRAAHAALVLLGLGVATSCSGGTDREEQLAQVKVEATADITPVFRPDTYDYNVWCENDSEQITVTWEESATPRVQLLTGGEYRDIPHENGEVTTTIHVGDALVVGLYAWRCMPIDMPRLQPEGRLTESGWAVMGLFKARDAALDDNQTRDSQGGWVTIVDENGAIVWYKRAETPMNPTRVDANRVAWLEDRAKNGVNIDPAVTFRIESLDGSETSELEAPEGWSIDFHELERAENEWWVIGTQIRENVEGYTGRVVIDGVLKLDDSFTWKHTDHILASETQNVPFPSIDGPVNDPVHMNSVQVQQNGDVLVGARELNEVFMIDRSSSKVRWRLRGRGAKPVAEHSDGAAVLSIAESERFSHPHDARLWDDGTLSVFDNRSDTMERARVAVYKIDEQTGSAQLVWSRTGTSTSTACGMVRRVGDHWLVSWGSSAAPLLEELDRDGVSVFSLRGDGTVMTYRANVEDRAAFSRLVLREAVR